MANGFITDIKESQGKFGPSYQIFIDGENRGFLKFAPKGMSVGDYVAYEAEQKGQYTNIKAGTLRKEAAPQGVAPPTPKAASVISMDRQDVISRQAALNSALAFVDVLQTAGALPDGKTLTAAKKADKIEAIVVEYMQKFHQWSTGAAYEMPESAVADAAQSWDEQE